MSKQSPVLQSGGLSRRNLLKTILFTPPILLFSKGGLFAGQEVKPLDAPRFIPKGEKIRAAVIGIFNRGSQVLNEFRKFPQQVEFVAFADVLFLSGEKTLKGFPGTPCFRDYREMLEQMHDRIDAVIICTPDHAHFPMVMHAMLLGKHVFVEKPMAQTVYECRLLETTARACKTVTQMGNQGHSAPGTVQFGRWVEAGLVKNVRKIDAWMTNSRRWHGWTDTAYPESIPPIGYDWDQWLCRRPFRPHSEKLIDGNWRCWYEFGCGAMGDWGAHILDAVHRYLKLGAPYEITTQLIGPSDLIYPQGSVITFKFKERQGLPPLELNWYDGQKNNPPAPPGMTEELGNVGSLIYTEEHIIRGGSHGAPYAILPGEKMESLRQAGKLPAADDTLPNHYQNFLNACQGIEPANSSFEVAAPLAEVLCLGCIGQRFGGTLQYDANAMQFANHPQATAMLKGPRVRDGWEAYDQPVPMKSKSEQIRKPDQAEWENLVHDETLSNWENPYEWGQAKVVGDEVHLTSEQGKWFLITKKDYTNFILEGEVRMPAGQGNSGFVFRCQKEKNRVWGYQAEVDTADRKWSGGLYDEGRRAWFISPNKDQAASEEEKEASIKAFRDRAGDSFKQDQWNHYRMECIGPQIRIFVNGTLATDIYDEMDLAGPVGIQHHGEPGLVYRFRNLRIKDLGSGGPVYYPHREKAKAAAAQSKMEGAIYEAEAANKTNDVWITDQHPGFQGTGYVDFGNAGSFVEWDNVLADAGGRFKLTFRYAAPNERPCELLINGQTVGRIPFASTGNWTTWKTVDTTVEFKTGRNAVRVVAIGNGPNLDAMAVNKS